MEMQISGRELPEMEMHISGYLLPWTNSTENKKRIIEPENKTSDARRKFRCSDESSTPIAGLLSV
ncbi:uncharacterized protein RCO7_14579 [Rhynchosporium graminicola]|uniref:Uncharacterized protein n=1 Tax=Rhynchosporium graminicola TaxID=2792576 RepID=A0A1E1KPZ2_9HELO|nr:uncharacterized protein RCO7_14579 [Rhynchosporium commune]